MFTRIPVFATVLGALAAAVVAVPAGTSSVREVIPGPGLPSLASLGVTSAELDYIGLPPAHGARAANYNGVCETSDTAATDDALKCFEYLWNLGADCVVHNKRSVSSFCEIGTAVVLGIDQSDTPLLVWPCRDVASAVAWVLLRCNANGQVGGSQTAYGSSEFVVILTHQ